MCKELFCWLAKRFGPCDVAVTEKEEDVIGQADFMPTEMADSYPVFTASWSDIKKELTALGLKPMEHDEDVPDDFFYYTDEESWAKILPSLTYSPKYFPQVQRKDCDDYSKKASADSSFYFGFNCIQDWGYTPPGYHAFNLVKFGLGQKQWKIFEPNEGYECSGQLLPLNNTFGWVSRKWKS